MTIVAWIVFSVMMAVAVVGLAIPMIRRYDGDAREGETITAVIRGELAAVDEQVAAGQVDTATAEALRTELKRRLLVERRARPVAVRLLSDRSTARLTILVSVGVALVATGVYAVNGRPDLAGGAPGQVAAEVAAATTPPPGDAAGGDIASQLETRLAQNPNDAEGWRLLATTYFQAQRFAEAANAYARAVALRPGDAALHSAAGEALTQAAGGVVTDPAKKAFTAALALDATDPRARYFLALACDQHGDHAAAISAWVALLNSAPADAPWAPELRRFVEKAATDAGISLVDRLTSVTPAAPIMAGAANARGPDAAAISAASGMTDEARAAFIRGMVDNLAAKLKANPRDADGWIRLIRSRRMLNDMPAAKAARDAGVAAFADTPATAKLITDAATALGVS